MQVRRWPVALALALAMLAAGQPVHLHKQVRPQGPPGEGDVAVQSLAGVSLCDDRAACCACAAPTAGPACPRHPPRSPLRPFG